MPGRKSRLSLDQRAALPLSQDNPDVEYLRLNRKDICRLEINAAVRLFLIDEDPISAHLLASAATEIMVALSDGKPGIGLNDMRVLIEAAAIPTDLSDELFQSLLHPYNFLKHSSRNYDIENNFSVEYTVMTIYTAVNSYKLLFTDLTAEMTVFNGVVQSWRIRWWEGTPGYEEKQKIARQLPLNESSSRKEVCKFGREMLERAGLQMRW